MKCEEFESTILDLDRAGRLSELEKSAAQAHLNSCERCASLQESWQGARRELAFYAQETQMAQAPARVEMRLRQEFRLQHRTTAPRKIAGVTVWALAAAAAVVAVVSWINWQNEHVSIARRDAPRAGAVTQPSVQENATGKVEVMPNPFADAGDESNALFADNELSGFTVLPGAGLLDTNEASILRVQMQRGTLSAYGLPVNEERAGEWIQVDLLVGDDGIPQAVRLPN